jgi:hypothetical protein
MQLASESRHFAAVVPSKHVSQPLASGVWPSSHLVAALTD